MFHWQRRYTGKSRIGQNGGCNPPSPPPETGRDPFWRTDVERPFGRKAPEGFEVEVFARDLVNPRMLAVSDAGVLYATRRSVGDVVMLKDGDGDGAADSAVTVASRPGMHGIAFVGDKVFLVTIRDVYTADVNDDGTFGPLMRIINDLPDAGQHANRTLGIGPDDMLYISSGSTCNGWPYVYGKSGLNPHIDPPEGISLEDWARQSTEPLLGYTPHSAPMQMAFYDGNAFPDDYRGDAFVAMRGSWNRRPPSGYEVVRINFENGKPVAFERFLEGFLLQQENGKYGYLGRLTGVAVSKDGALFVADDSNGIVYRVRYEGKQQGTANDIKTIPDVVTEKPATKIALDLVEARDAKAIAVRSAFPANQPIPLQYAADGDNASPALEWDGPEETKSYVVVVDDPDADKPKPFTHWLAYDIPADTTKLREGLPGTPILQYPKGLKQGANSMGSIGYTGPKPPAGDPAHHYHFQVFALDVDTLGIDPGATREDVLKAMSGHVLSKGEIVGTFGRKAAAN